MKAKPKPIKKPTKEKEPRQPKIDLSGADFDQVVRAMLHTPPPKSQLKTRQP